MSQLNFAELFKSTHEDHSQHPVNKSRFILSIGYYFFVMLIVASFVFLIVDRLGDTTIPTLKETLTPQEEVNRLFEEYDNLIVILPSTYQDAFSQVTTYPFNDDYFMIVYPTFDDFIDVDGVLTIPSSYIILSLESENIVVATQESHIPESLTNFNIINTLQLDSPIVLTTFSMSLINFIVYLLLFPVLILLLKPYIIKDIQDAVVYRPKWIALLIAGYFYVLAGNIFSNLLTQLIYFVTGEEMTTAVNQAIIEASLQSDGSILMILSAVFLGPVVEELIFRKAFFGIIKKEKLAMIISSITFGLIHVISEPTLLDLLINIIPYVVMGFVFGFLYVKHQKNLVIVTLVHIITNLISIITILFIL